MTINHLLWFCGYIPNPQHAQAPMGIHFSFNPGLAILLLGVGHGVGHGFSSESHEESKLGFQEQYGHIHFSAICYSSEGLGYPQIQTTGGWTGERQSFHGKSCSLALRLRGFRGVCGSENVMHCCCIIAGAPRRLNQGRTTATKQRWHSFMDKNAFFLRDFWCVWSFSGKQHVF